MKNIFLLYLKNLLINFKFNKFLNFFIELFKSNIQNKKIFLMKILLNFIPIKILNFIKKFLNYEISNSWIKLENKNDFKNYKNFLKIQL